MFEPSDRPRVFGLPPGAEFPRVLIDGLLRRIGSHEPESLGRVQIFVNTRRMQRRIRALFDAGPPRLLPRIRLVTDLATEVAVPHLPPPVSPLRRRLELSQLVSKLLESEPDLAPRNALFDLSDSLADLMDEMRGEGIAPDALRALDVSDVSGHWQRSLKFVALVDRFFGSESDEPPDPEARQRMVIEHLVDKWQTRPPSHPVIVAGSTGSRGATALFMRAVACLPQGAVVLPGVDFDLPDTVWNKLDTALNAEDHPQYRFARLMSDLGGHPRDIQPWHPDAAPPNSARNRLLSLALRPAPVTDQWLSDGRRLTDIGEATDDMALIEAESSRSEANAIALALREAAETGMTAALITPDQILTRQVTAALDRWRVEPDDSAGKPLPLSPPGRFLRHVADRFGQVWSVEALLTLLKHPLANSSVENRGAHLLNTRELELDLRRHGPPFPERADVLRWAAKDDADRLAWAQWVGAVMEETEAVGTRQLSEHLRHHIRLAETLAAGPGQEGTGALWDKAAGIEAQRRVEELRRESAFGGVVSPFDYASLFNSVLKKGEVREPTQAHPGVMIWGTLEARVQGADLVILGGLNEGVWPEAPGTDPWLNRVLRDRAGLLLPERRIGLAAHDFQQAAAAPKVILSRSIRDAEAQTVPSRWLNRLCNLLGGLPQDGPAALDAMRARGKLWLDLADALDAPDTKVTPALRPSPQPPVKDRPKEISITEVQTLIRDPYAIYARRILGLNALDPLRRQPDPPLRGTLIHRIMERFVGDGPVTDPIADKMRLIATADAVFAAEAPWPAAQRLWRARLLRVVDWFIETEIARQVAGVPGAQEVKARMTLPNLDHVLYGKIDRVDRLPDGSVAIYDYKSGAPPAPLVQDHFDKQLMLSALLVERGTLEGFSAAKVAEVGYIGFGGTGKIDTKHVDTASIEDTLAGLEQLIGAYRNVKRGYTSRRAVETQGFASDFDHLARLGEWDESDPPNGAPVG